MFLEDCFYTLVGDYTGVYISCDANIFAPPPFKNHSFSPNPQFKNRSILQVSEARADFQEVCCGGGGGCKGAELFPLFPFSLFISPFSLPFSLFPFFFILFPQTQWKLKFLPPTPGGVQTEKYTPLRLINTMKTTFY